MFNRGCSLIRVSVKHITSGKNFSSTKKYAMGDYLRVDHFEFKSK